MNDFPLYLDVPFAEKDEAKSRGAHWDPVTRRWYVGSLHLLVRDSRLLRWVPTAVRASLASRITEAQRERWHAIGRIPLEVPFGDGDAVRRLGAKWSSTHDCWTVDLSQIEPPHPFCPWLAPGLEADFDAALKALREERDIHDWYRTGAPRSEDPEEMLALFGLDPRRIYKASGFCPGCDSDYRNDWVVAGQCLHHYRSMPPEASASFRQRGKGPEGARLTFSAFFNEAEISLIKDWLEGRPR